MRNLYVIVHEGSVRISAFYKKGPEQADALRVLKVIRHIKHRHNPLSFDGAPSSDIPDGLPEPAEDLRVLLVGAYKCPGLPQGEDAYCVDL